MITDTTDYILVIDLVGKVRKYYAPIALFTFSDGLRRRIDKTIRELNILTEHIIVDKAMRLAVHKQYIDQIIEHTKPEQSDIDCLVRYNETLSAQDFLVLS